MKSFTAGSAKSRVFFHTLNLSTSSPALSICQIKSHFSMTKGESDSDSSRPLLSPIKNS